MRQHGTWEFIVKAAVNAGRILGENKLLVDEWLRYVEELPRYPDTGDEKPVIIDVEDAPVVEYNIPVPAFPVFPGEDIGLDSDEKLKQMAMRTIEKMETNKNNDLVVLSMAKIRLCMKDAYHFLRGRILSHIRENGTLRLSPEMHMFNSLGIYTEMFGIVMPINELLLQSNGGIVRLFPVWPKKINASFQNLRTEGAFLISSECIDGKVGNTVVTSLAGGGITLRNEWGCYTVSDDNDLVIKAGNNGELNICFVTSAGMKYRICGDG
jgi:hypothetical protein